MSVVRVEPSGIELDLEPDETLLQSARRHGVRWPSMCGGNAECKTCFVVLLEGQPLAASEREIKALDSSFPNHATAPPKRLACQLRSQSDLVVRKSGVRAAL